MQQPPERPFVPRRTPTRPQPAFGSSDFALSRPFVPGAEREQIASFSIEATVESRSAPSTALPPIDNFLDSPPTRPGVTGAEREEETLAEEYAGEDELPPVEHFIDPLPDVGDFAEASGELQGDEPYSAADTTIADAAATEWVETDWQQYDWRSAAALGDTGDSEASTAWAATDWDASIPPAREPRPTPAQAIASALDQIAQRIRDGELPAPGGTTDPKSIAATLAALLGIRQ